jgi:hypothetical protein
MVFPEQAQEMISTVGSLGHNLPIPHSDYPARRGEEDAVLIPRQPMKAKTWAPPRAYYESHIRKIN